MSAGPRTGSERATRCASILGVGGTKINRGDYRTSVVALVSREKWLRARRGCGIVGVGKNLFPKQRRTGWSIWLGGSKTCERNEPGHRKRVTAWRKPSARFRKWWAIPDGTRDRKRVV